MSFGGVIKLQGETAYRKAIKNIDAGLRALGSELKKTASEFATNDKSVENLTAQNNVLNKNIVEQKNKIATLKGAIKDATEKYGENSAQVKNWQTKLNNAETQLNKFNRTVEENKKDIAAETAEIIKSKTPYENLNRTIGEQEKRLEELRTAYKNATLAKNNNNVETQKLKKGIERLSAELHNNKLRMSEAEKAANSLGIDIEISGEKAEKAANGGFTVFRGLLANLGSQAVSRAISGVKQLGKSMFDAGADFEAAMSQVEAISGASGKELTALNAKAKQMGSTTKFTATESAEAFNYMAMAGWKTNDMLNGIEGIMSLAAASGNDLAGTSDIVTDALTAMGYTAGDAGKLADVMASASANANTNVALMGSTFQYAAPIVGSLGYSMEDTAVAIGLMANAGIKGDKAGTALRSTLSRLSAPPKAAAEAMENLGITITDANGKMKPLRTVIDDLRAKFKGMTETQQTANAKAIAGTTAMSGLLAIVNAAPSDYNKLKKAVDNSTGASSKMSKTMQNNVRGTLTKLKSQIEGIYIQIFKKLAPSFQSAATQASKFVKSVDWNSFGNTVKTAFGKALDGLKWIIKNKDLLITSVKMMIAAFAVNKIWDFTKGVSASGKQLVDFAKKIILTTTLKNADTTAEGTNTAAKVTGAVVTGALTKAQIALNAAMTANPIGAVVLALGALVAAIALVVNMTNRMTDAEKKEQEQLEATKQHLKEQKESWNNLEAEKHKAIDAGETEMTHYQTLWEELQKIVDQNGKVKKGYEERASFITSTLSDALGIEIENVKGVIKKYDLLKEKIDEVIEKKKAKIVLDAQEAGYKDAIKNQAEATRELMECEAKRDNARKEANKLFANLPIKSYEELEKAIANIKKQGFRADRDNQILNMYEKIKKRYLELTATQEENYSNAENRYYTYVQTISQYESNLEKFHAGNYDKMTKATFKYVKNSKKAGDSEKKLLEDNIAAENYHIKKLREMRNKGNKDAINSQIKEAKNQRKAYQDQLQQYINSSQENLKGASIIWNDNLAKQLSAITGKNIEFKKAGKNNVQMMVDGIKYGEEKSKSAMAALVTKMIAKITGKKGKAAAAGRDLINGLNDGITDKDALSETYKSIENFGNNLLKRLKDTLKEKSPSKATEEMGIFLAKGISVGVKKEQKNTLALLDKFGKNLLKKIALHPEKAETYGKKYLSSFSKGIQNSVASVKKSVKNLADSYIAQLKNSDISKETKAFFSKFGKNVISDFNTAIDKACNEATTQLSNRITKLTKQLQEKTTEVQNKIADMSSKLKSYGDLFTVETSDVNSQKIVRLTDPKEKYEDLKRYEYLLTSLKGKIHKGLMSEITSLSIEDALLYAEQLSLMSDEQLAEYNKNDKKRYKLADKIAKEFYSDDLKSIKENYTNKIEAEFKTAKNKISKMGKQTMQGFIKGMQAEKYTKEIQSIAKKIVKTMKKTLGINSPSRVFRDEIGKNSALGLVGGFGDTMAKISRKMTDAVPKEFDSKLNVDTSNIAQRVNVGNFNCNVTINADNINNDREAQRIGTQITDTIINELFSKRGAYSCN